jgi:hypothetical protein
VESDALKMREFLAEGDVRLPFYTTRNQVTHQLSYYSRIILTQLLVAEVQSTEGMIQLHTRSLKYGKVSLFPFWYPRQPVILAT